MLTLPHGGDTGITTGVAGMQPMREKAALIRPTIIIIGTTAWDMKTAAGAIVQKMMVADAATTTVVVAIIIPTEDNNLITVSGCKNHLYPLTIF